VAAHALTTCRQLTSHNAPGSVRGQ